MNLFHNSCNQHLFQEGSGITWLTFKWTTQLIASMQHSEAPSTIFENYMEDASNVMNTVIYSQTTIKILTGQREIKNTLQLFCMCKAVLVIAK